MIIQLQLLSYIGNYLGNMIYFIIYNSKLKHLIYINKIKKKYNK